jgi:two-component system cell cycle response regulator
MKVLIADDEPVSRRLLELSLRRWGYEVVVASDGLEVSQIIAGPNPPKLLVLDWLMPGMDGIELCREIRQRQSESTYTYVLLLTSKRSQNDVIEGLESGADDYLTKPFDPHELKVRLRTGRRILHLMDQLVATREALRELAMHDALTGLLNRAAIQESFENELMRARREGTSLGVVMVDVDHFKSINDKYGHPAGDAVLRETARTMRGLIRTYDAAGRYGGEEFLIILPGCDEVTAVSHAERVRKALSRLVVTTEQGEIAFTASFGVAVAGRESTYDAGELIQLADQALYCAKRQGRNRVEIGAAALVTACESFGRSESQAAI